MYTIHQSSQNVAVVLGFSKGSFDEGFSVTLAILEDGRTIMRDRNCPQLTAAPDIPILYQNWQAKYDELGKKRNAQNAQENEQEGINLQEGIRGIQAVVGQTTHYSALDECQQAAGKLEGNLKKWFKHQNFQSLRDRVRAEASVGADQSVPIIFDFNTGNTEQDALLRKLPWHCWDLFDYLRHAEVVLSNGNYQPSKPFSRPVKILAIFGSSEGGLQLQDDKEALEKLRQRGAELVCMEQPHRRELHKRLWEQSWDILFFAGHSSSEEGQKTGRLQIRNGKSISLDALKEDLKRAVEKGLKLAIFNSCQGLGIVDFLADLKVPTMIVMREPVPDIVARRFLSYFLDEFSNGKPLYLATREARSSLDWMEEDDEKPCPAATWLPVICQNSTQPELFWPEPIIPPRLPLWKKIVAAVIATLVTNKWKTFPSAAIMALVTIGITYEITRWPKYAPSNVFSLGEEFLIPREAWENDKNYQACVQQFWKKKTGTEAFKDSNFDKAIQRFNSFLKDCPFDPETRIYLNNAKVLQNSNSTVTQNSVFGSLLSFLPSFSQKTFTIATVVPIGSEPWAAQEAMRGVAQAQDEINQTGINERQLLVQVVNDDTPGNNGISDLAQDVAIDLKRNRSIFGVMGHYNSDVTKLAGDEYEKGGLVVISPTSTAIRKSVDSKGLDFSRYVFRTAPTDATAAKKLVNAIRSSGYQRVALVYDSSNGYSKSLHRELTKEFNANGGKTVTPTECDLSLSNTRFEAPRCVDRAFSEAEALLLIPGTEIRDRTQLVVKENHDRQNRLPLFGGDAVYSGRTLENVGSQVEGMIVAVPYYPQLSAPDFLKNSQELWGTTDVSWRTAMAYDATQAFAQGLRLMGDNPSRKGMKYALLRKDFFADGAMGPRTVKFDGRGDRDLNGIDNKIGVLVRVKRVGDQYKFVPVRQ